MRVYLFASLIGMVVGPRTFTAPAVVSWAARLQWWHLSGTPLGFLGSPAAPLVLTMPAIGELVIDKLRNTPSRKAPTGFVARIVAMSAPEATGPGAMRIDRWLFGARLFKTRSAAAEAVRGGKVHLNGKRVNPSHGVKPGDTVTFARGAVVFDCVVAAVPLRRGPASEAARSYDETPASKARREEFAARMKVAAGLSPRPDDRPNKHDRRLLRQLRGRN